MDEHPPPEPRSQAAHAAPSTCIPRAVSGFAGLLFLLFLLLGVSGSVPPPSAFLMTPAQATGTCPLHLDPEDARLNASAQLHESRVHNAQRSQSGTERGHAFFAGVASRPAAQHCAAPEHGLFPPVDWPFILLPGHHGPVAFALPPPSSFSA